MKKFLIYTFAIIGVISMLACIIFVGYTFGIKSLSASTEEQGTTPTPTLAMDFSSINETILTPTIVPTGTNTPVPTSTPTPVVSLTPTNIPTNTPTPISTPMPTELPKQEDLTFTAMDDSISWFPLTAINVWSEATDFGKKVGTLEGKGCLVVVDSVCNETGYYHVLYAGPTDTDFSEGYIHPDHFRYLTTAEEEYNKKVEAGLINPDEIPSNTPSTEVPTPAPTAKPTETPSESEQANPTEAPAKPTEKPSTPSATDYDSYKIKYKYFKDYITGYTDEGYPILPDGTIITPNSTPETIGYNPATIDGYTEEGYVIIGGFPCIPTDTIHGDSQDGGEYGGGTFEGGIH